VAFFTRRRPAADESFEDEVQRRLERVSALVYALLHDVAAWLTQTEGPVSAEQHPGYRLRQFADVPAPADRMARYLNSAVLESWRPVLDRWLAYGYRYRPSFGRNVRVAVTEGGEEGPRAVVTFLDRSEVEVPGGARQCPRREWTMTLWVRPDLKEIASVVLRAAGPAS
jgi:hypothetical protein